MGEANQYKDDVSLRDLFLKIGEYVRYFWRKKWWILAGVLLGAAWFIYRHWDKPEVFVGSLSFVVNDEQGGGSGGVGSILGQIGFGGGSDDQKMAKVTAFSTSRRIIYDALIDSVEIDGESNLLGNHFIAIHNLSEEWFEKINPNLADFTFSEGNRDSLKSRDLRILKLLHIRIFQQRDPLFEVKYDEDTGFFTFTFKGRSQDMTISFLESVYRNLEVFYVKTSVGSQEHTLEELRQRSDSIFAALNQVEYRLANMEDRSLGLINQSDRVRMQQLQREASLLNGMYLEVLRNKESAEFLLNTNRPRFDVVDEPALPLASIEPEPIKDALLGGVFGGFILTMIFLLRKAYLDIMRRPSVYRPE